MQRYLTERLRDLGSNRALVFYTPHTPSHPRQWGQLQCGQGCPWPVVLLQQVPHSINTALVVRIVVAVRGEGGGAARRLTEILAGVRRTMIEAGRYRAGLMGLSTGGRKR